MCWIHHLSMLSETVTSQNWTFHSPTFNETAHFIALLVVVQPFQLFEVNHVNSRQTNRKRVYLLITFFIHTFFFLQQEIFSLWALQIKIQSLNEEIFNTFVIYVKWVQDASKTWRWCVNKFKYAFNSYIITNTIVPTTILFFFFSVCKGK